MPEDLIEIKQENMPAPLSEYTETKETELVCLDLDKDLWVKFGVPVIDRSSANPELDIPYEPHVFMAHDLWLTDKKNENLLIQNVPVIYAHGYRDDETWRFANGQPILDTVNAFDDYAKRNKLPNIEFVVACNRDNRPDPLGIQIKDFPSNKIIAQAVGEVIYLELGKMTQDGKTSLSLKVDGEFWGLEDLKTYKRIEVVDKNNN